MHDTEDKQWWVVQYAKQEEAFVQKVCPVLGLTGVINPKKTLDQYAPDIIVDGQLSDLKCQNTPFFKSQVLYRLDPQHCVTFNQKDYLRYKKLYPHILVYFWVDWQKTELTVRGEKYQVVPMAGVWRTPFSLLADAIEKGRAPLHSYQRRGGDTQGNAKASYLFDIRKFERLKQVDPRSQ